MILPLTSHETGLRADMCQQDYRSTDLILIIYRDAVFLYYPKDFEAWSWGKDVSSMLVVRKGKESFVPENSDSVLLKKEIESRMI